ncbi:hypothetical protein ACOSP7_010145 [Xanthoceras sorbifolium]
MEKPILDELVMGVQDACAIGVLVSRKYSSCANCEESIVLAAEKVLRPFPRAAMEKFSVDSVVICRLGIDQYVSNSSQRFFIFVKYDEIVMEPCEKNAKDF